MFFSRLPRYHESHTNDHHKGEAKGSTHTARNAEVHWTSNDTPLRSTVIPKGALAFKAIYGDLPPNKTTKRPEMTHIDGWTFPSMIKL